MIPQALPDIPRLYTGLAEWSAALVYILLMRPRFTKRWQVLLIVAGLLVLAGLQSWVGGWPLSLWIPGMVLAVVAMFGFIYSCTITTFRDAWYLTARAFILAELVASLEWQLWVYWWRQAPSPSADFTSVLWSVGLMAVCYGAAFSLAYYLERRHFPRRARLEVDSRTLTTSLTILVVTFLGSNLSFLTSSTPFSGQHAVDIFYIRTLVDLAGFVALYAQQSNLKHMRDSTELAEVRLVMRAQQEQHLLSKRNAEELNRMHHDLKYVAAAIRSEASAERRSEYLQALEDSVRGYESEIATGHSSLDAVLSAKMARCQSLGIAMTNMVNGAALDFIGPVQLSVIFGNALDNAIEAVSKIPDEERRLIKVSAFPQGSFMVIRIENHFPYSVDFSGGLPVTSKDDRASHGFGTANIRHVVESLGGSVIFTVEDNWFFVRALIPIPGPLANPATGGHPAEPWPTS